MTSSFFTESRVEVIPASKLPTVVVFEVIIHLLGLCLHRWQCSELHSSYCSYIGDRRGARSVTAQSIKGVVANGRASQDWSRCRWHGCVLPRRPESEWSAVAR